MTQHIIIMVACTLY